MPIPLTPPDDEVGIGIPDYVIIYKGYFYYDIHIMAHLPFCFRLCQPYDYVYLYYKAMPLYDSAFFIFIYPVSVYFILIYFPPILKSKYF